MSEMAENKSRRRWFRFGLRTLLIAVLVFSLPSGWFAWKANEARKRKRAVAWVHAFGGRVNYEFEIDEFGEYHEAEPPATLFLRNLLGMDFFADIASVDLSGTKVNQVAPLDKLSKLEYLDLTGSRVADLSTLAGMKYLKELYLGRGSPKSDRLPLSDLRPLAELRELQRLSLQRTEVSDLSPLATLTNLQTLNLERTLVSDLTPLGDLQSLDELWLRGTPVSDLTPLANLANVTIHVGRLQDVTVPKELEGQVIRE